jgi:hypothetical protein
MDDGVVVGLHKLDKACQMLCGACVKGAREATGLGAGRCGRSCQGVLSCRLGELKDEL